MPFASLLREGKLGKVLMYQTEFFRNSDVGQWRYYKLTPSMTPKNINWNAWLGVDDGLAENQAFDREVYAQWRRFWPFGSGMYTDLFVHRTTAMLKATGLRFPGRVVGAGGLFDPIAALCAWHPLGHRCAGRAALGRHSPVGNAG